MRFALISLVAGVASLTACADAPADSPFGTGDDGKADGAGGLVWPNQDSHANSDAWIAEHHDQLRQMRPRVLLLNYGNGRSIDEVNAYVRRILDGLGEGSRYHGYMDAGAPRFLDYRLVHTIDLADDTAGVNSQRLPRIAAEAGNQVDYGQLFTSDYAAIFGVPDPDDSSRYLDLCGLFQRGIIHELWFTYRSGEPGLDVDESQSSRQVYDADDHPIAGDFDPCAGNATVTAGCMPAQLAAVAASCGVTVKIKPVQLDRGPGAAIHALGHEIEKMSKHGVPSIDADFRRFANMDLDTRFGYSFPSWYYPCKIGDKGCITFSSENALSWVRSSPGNASSTKSGTIDVYDQGCGSVHFPANARYQYDYAHEMPVLARCAGFGLGENPDGTDAQEAYSATTIAALDDVWGTDNGGGWQVYWRQSMPGLGNKARSADGRPIKNWWPYLFY